MAHNVFEESTLTLSAWITRGKGERATAKFEFEQEGGSEKIEAAELELGEKGEDGKKVSTVVTLPKCKDDEESYTFSYKVTCGDIPYPGADFRVWPRSAVVKAVDADGKTLKGVPLTFSQTGDEKIFRTDSKGECPIPLNGTAPCTVKVLSPCSLLEWTTEKGRAREAKVEKKEYKALLVQPSVEGNSESAPLKQYVNLAADPKNPKCGTLLKVVLGGQTDDECIEGIPGDIVHIKVEFDTDNSKRNDLKRGIVVAGSKTEPGDDGVATAQVPYDEKGAAEFEVELGYAGGDKAKISVGITEACEDGTLHVQNWRQLWYQLTVPAGTSAPKLDRMKAALAEVFVEYDQHGETVEIAEGDGPKGSWFDGAWVGDDGKKLLNIGDHNKGFFHKKFSNAKSPHMVHVLCCHTQFDTLGKGTTVGVKDLKLTHKSTVKWSDGKDVVGFAGEVGSGFFPKRIGDAGSSFLSGSWKSDDGKESGKLAEGDFHIVKSKVTFKLPADAVKYLGTDDKKNVLVTFNLFKAKGPYLGEADAKKGYLQLIVLRCAENVSNDVMAHELGHTMHQVPQSAAGKPPGLSGVRHGREYVANGHQGGHCADGMSKSNYAGGAGKAGTKYAKNFAGKKECTCIMYGENGAGSSCTGKFCARCKPFIQAQALDALT